MDCALHIRIYILIDQSIFHLSVCLSSGSFILTRQRACMTSPLPLLRPATWLCTLETVSKESFPWECSSMEWVHRFPSSTGGVERRLDGHVEKGNGNVETPLNERRSLDSLLLRLYPSTSFFLLFFTDLKNLVLMANRMDARDSHHQFPEYKEKDSIPLCPFSLPLPGTPLRPALDHSA